MIVQNIAPYKTNVSFKSNNILSPELQQVESQLDSCCVSCDNKALQDAIRAQAMTFCTSTDDANLMLEAFKLKYNSSKIIRQANKILSEAQSNYDRTMYYGNVAKATDFAPIYEDGELKAAFVYEYDYKNDCLVDGYMRIKEFDSDKNVIRSSITEDNTDSWCVHETSSDDPSKENVFNVFDFVVCDLYKGASHGKNGGYDADCAIFKDEAGMTFYKGVKGLKSLSSNRADQVEQIFTFDENNKLKEFAYKVQEVNGQKCAEQLYTFNEDGSFDVIIDYNKPQEKVYSYNPQS